MKRVLMNRKAGWRLAAMTVLVAVSACTSTPPIQSAIYEGDIERIRTLLEAGADVDQPGNYLPPALLEMTPLMLASKRGDEEIVQLLLDYGAAVDRESELLRTTALFYASWAGHPEIVQILLSAGASINAQIYRPSVGETSWPVLHVAARAGHADVVAVLLEGGADIDLQAQDDGETALMVASQQGNEEVVKTLLEAGASIHLRDDEGRTALSHTMLNNVSVVHSQRVGGTSMGTTVSIPPDNEAVFDTLIDAGAEPEGLIESLYAAGARGVWAR